MKTLVVQGDWLLKKAHFAGLSTRVNGHPCGGIIGFMNSLREVISSYLIDKIVVAWDGELDGFRKYDRYPVLKAEKQEVWDRRIKVRASHPFDLSRKERFESDVLSQRTILQEHLDMLGVRQMQEETSEAIDAIALYVNEAITVGEEVIILSREHTFSQLVSDNVSVLSDGLLIGRKNFLDLYRYDPSNDLMLKCFIGMPSGVPGVRGLSMSRMTRFFSGLKLEHYPYADLIAYARRKKVDVRLKIYEAVLSAHEVVARNAKLINQRDPIFNSDLNEQKNYCLYSPLERDGTDELYRKYGMYEDLIGPAKEFFRPFQRMIMKEREYALFHEQVNI